MPDIYSKGGDGNAAKRRPDKVATEGRWMLLDKDFAFKGKMGYILKVGSLNNFGTFGQKNIAASLQDKKNKTRTVSDSETAQVQRKKITVFGFHFGPLIFAKHKIFLTCTE